MASDKDRDDARDSIGQELLREFHSLTNQKKRRRLGFDIIAQTPPERTGDLLAFLDDQDLWVQERAAEELGKRRFEPAIDALLQVALRETTRVHNARIGAILALGRMKSDRGLHSLLHLASAIPAGFHNYIMKGLELHGCPTQYDGKQWKFQLPGTAEWRTL